MWGVETTLRPWDPLELHPQAAILLLNLRQNDLFPLWISSSLEGNTGRCRYRRVKSSCIFS